MSKRIALCIASRGNPRQLLETLNANLRVCSLPSTRIVVGLDEDDPALANTRRLLDGITGKRIVVSLAPRADTIGAVYNRCASAIDADLYINGADDVRITTPGWDAILSDAATRFPDGIGMIGFGRMPIKSILPALEAVTPRFIEKMGYFMQDHTPYWWMDTWLYEIAVMIGRVHYADVDVACIGPLRTRGLRDLVYWATFFDAMRVHRRAVAEAILADADFLETAERKQALRDDLDQICAEFDRNNACLRDPAHAQRLEGTGHDAPADERYRRAMDRSLTVLQELERDGTRVA
jgi:hypothetical protein